MARAVRQRRSRRTLATFLVLVLLSVTIITLDETGRASSLTSGLKSLASDIYSPLRHGVNGVLDPIGRFFAGAVSYSSLEAENQKLQNQVLELEHQRASDAVAQRQYAALQRLLATERLPSIASLPRVTAEVTAQNVSDFAATVSIDKGRDQGVASGDPVVGPGGLVGEVATVTRSTATVRLLTDGKSQIGVSLGHQQAAILDGAGAGRLLQIQYVPSTARVFVGELISTSGLQGGALPPGIPVATVASVRNVVGAADKQVTARPLAVLNDLTYVTVIQWSGSS